MIKKIFVYLLVMASAVVFAAPAPFELPKEFVLKAPPNLRAELKKYKVNTLGYTAAAMKILEDRIQKRMRLLDFNLIHTDAVKGMAFSEKYRPSDVMLQLTSAERRNLFSSGKKGTQILLRYTKSFKIRQETIRLFRQCKPVIAENRFHSSLFALLEFQHIYLEQEFLKFRKGGR